MAWCAGCLWEIPPTILSDSSVVCSAFTPPFNIGAACLAPRTRWYNKKLNKKPIQPWLDVLSRHQLNVCMCMNLPTVERDGKALSAQNLTSSWLFFFFFKCLHVLQHAVIHVSVCLLRNRTQRPLFALLSTVCRCTSAHSEKTYHHYWLAGGPNSYLPSDVIVYQIAFKPAFNTC